MDNKALARNSGDTLPILKIETPADLLKAPHMTSHVKQFGEQKVLNTIAGFLVKCSVGLGIQMPPDQCHVLSEDILARYRYESLEDVIECLKKGRRGLFGFGHNRRDTINMILFSEWMEKHLEDKAALREQKHTEKNNNAADLNPKTISPEVAKQLEELKKRWKEEEQKQKKPSKPKKTASTEDLIRGYAMILPNEDLSRLIKTWEKEERPEEHIDILREEVFDRELQKEKQEKENERFRKMVG